MAPESRPIWDIQTRLIHWALALCILLNLFLLEEGEDPHQYVGYAAVVLVLMRSVWGRFAQGPANFRQFPISPSHVISYLKNNLKDDPDETRHNPMASWVYIFMWLSVIALGTTGWMMGLDAFWGNETLEDIHSSISVFIQVLIGAHFVGMTIDSVRYKRKTWLGMITGRKG